jgi:hypothetical protein
MTQIDLNHIGLTIPHRWEAIKWLEKNYGTMDKGFWKISNLQYVEFKEDKHATLFLLKWS